MLPAQWVLGVEKLGTTTGLDFWYTEAEWGPVELDTGDPYLGEC